MAISITTYKYHDLYLLLDQGLIFLYFSRVTLFIAGLTSVINENGFVIFPMFLSFEAFL